MPARLDLRQDHRFLAEYQRAFGTIHGAFTMNAAVIFAAYAALAREDGASGPVLEIGVHQGLSAILVAALREPGAPMVAIDTFGASPDATVSGGMAADEGTFLANMTRYHGDARFVRVIARDSRGVRADELGRGFSFCHIDGGHSAEETHHDLTLASAVAAPGAIVAIDDYFNPSFPGVSEGTVRFLIQRRGELAPVAIGANKVLFRRSPSTRDLNARFIERYPFIPRTRATFEGRDVLVFGSAVASHVDVERSTLDRLVARDVALRAEIEPERAVLEARPGQAVPLAVRVRNRSDIPFEWSEVPFGLSYHLTGPVERYENARTWFIPPLAEGEERAMTISVVAPERAGEYVVEVDIVWEGICWLRERGNAPARVHLGVT